MEDLGSFPISSHDTCTNTLPVFEGLVGKSKRLLTFSDYFSRSEVGFYNG